MQFFFHLYNFLGQDWFFTVKLNAYPVTPDADDDPDDDETQTDTECLRDFFVRYGVDVNDYQ